MGCRASAWRLRRHFKLLAFVVLIFFDASRCWRRGRSPNFAWKCPEGVLVGVLGGEAFFAAGVDTFDHFLAATAAWAMAW